MEIFQKYNSTEFQDYLLKEKNGLETLRAHLAETDNAQIQVPEIFSCEDNCLAIQKIHAASPTAEQFSKLGKGLAIMHKHVFTHYGLAENNYIGLSKQINELTDNWGRLFFSHRLMYQVSLIKDSQLKAFFEEGLNNNQNKLIGFLNEYCSHASLIHGDLWSGNVLFDQQRVWLIDPAVYYGDREADLAMTEMFGGFSQAFYNAYDSVLPRSSVYRHKRQIYNLYHYLNHFNLFGQAYLPECVNGIEYISKL